MGVKKPQFSIQICRHVLGAKTPQSHGTAGKTPGNSYHFFEAFRGASCLRERATKGESGGSDGGAGGGGIFNTSK